MNGENRSYSITAIVALALAILSFIPFLGVILLPVALILNIISLAYRNNGMAIATIIIGIVKIVISPTLWLAFNGDWYTILYIILVVVNIGFVIKNNMQIKKRVRY